MKKTPTTEELVKLAENNGNDADLLILDKVTDLEEEVAIIKEQLAKDPPEDAKIEKIASRLATKMSISAEDVRPTKDEIMELIKPLIPEVKNGEDYVLTEADKQEIAQSVVIPTVEVEKVVETIIKEQPIVTEIVKEVAIAETPEVVRDKLESLKGDDRLDASAIKGLSKREKKLSDDLINRAISIVDQRTSFSINKAEQLRTDVNTKVTGWGTKNIYVQATAPTNPSLLDLWVDIS